ncbi:secretory lipase-domain-containing protein [Lophiotrema nucula]|uniref:Secretory lipase-domain-containing protein n=1 Tax=Lophiotrema nucula TaxID=690887 RepID=A0A6A5YRZ2_9PLEO|nr:secretory lipase-domain-containing protein [Lophiotrema nucula]
MSRFFCSLLALSYFLKISISAATEPTPPSEDPWYTAPPHFASAAPGDILRIRHAPGNLTSIVGNASAAYNILFRTTDSHYKPSWAVTTLFIPNSNTSNRVDAHNASLLSIQFAYNSANVDSSPSYGLYNTLAAPGLGIPPSTEDISQTLGHGWYVNTPDFEGPLASFGLGIQEGHATLDSVRAALSSKLIPHPKSTKYAMWGYSGGSLASEWASELQEQYAPELAFSGAALGGMVPNFTNIFDNITGSPYAGLIPLVLLGSTSQDPEARDYLVSRLHQSGPYNASYFLHGLDIDVNTAFGVYAGQNIYDYFIGGRQDIVGNPILQPIFNRNGYEGFHGVPRFPTFVYKAVGDEFSRVQDTDALVERWCSVGTPTWYQRNLVGGHIAEITNGRGRAIEWLKTVFDGTYKPNGCLVEDVTVNITSITA